jgi:Raf kinase inhibitor-like YbhB/YbcL family protein
MKVVYKTAIFVVVLCLAALLLAGCQSQEVSTVENTLSLSCAAFSDGGAIPDKYTCRGEDISPPLVWGEPPAGTRSLALVIDDLDTSGKFTHWVVFNIPADTRGLPESVSGGSVVSGALEGKNDFGKIGYGGPCPPPGKAHRYRFTLYALDAALSLEAGVSKGQVLDAVEGHILAQGQVIGTYQR